MPEFFRRQLTAAVFQQIGELRIQFFQPVIGLAVRLEREESATATRHDVVFAGRELGVIPFARREGYDARWPSR